MDTVDYSRPVTSVWSSYGHTFVGTGDAGTESCLTCGAHFTLVNLGDGRGDYRANNGDGPIQCTGRTDISHGYERVCEADNGQSCEASRDTGTCEHIDHVCNCILCD